MNNKQLIELINFRKNGIYTQTKQTDSDIDELLSDLKSLGLISKKPNSQTLEIIDSISFDKLIEFKSLSDFKKWYLDRNKSIINDFSGSTIGQINQSPEKINLKNPIKQNIVNKTAKKSSIEIATWVIGIIVGCIAIYEFIIKNFIK